MFMIDRLISSVFIKFLRQSFCIVLLKFLVTDVATEIWFLCNFFISFPLCIRYLMRVDYLKLSSRLPQCIGLVSI